MSDHNQVIKIHLEAHLESLREAMDASDWDLAIKISRLMANVGARLKDERLAGCLQKFEAACMFKESGNVTIAFGKLSSLIRNRFAKTIVLNEDEDELRLMIEQFLLAKGFRVISCANSCDALKAINDEYVDLVITDLRVPGLSGGDLIRHLQDLNITIPVVAMSGQEIEEGHANYFFQKPFSLREFADSIGKNLGSAGSGEV
jgi:two-component system, response regulator, stage 0 sporulation protein F